MLHTTDSHVFTGTCRRECKTNTHDPLRKDILNAFPGMTEQSGKVDGNLFPGTEEGIKTLPPLCIITCVIYNSVIPYSEGIRVRFSSEVWILVDHLSCRGRRCWALYKSQFLQLRSASHLSGSPHTGGDQIVQMRKELAALSKVFLFFSREIFYFLLMESLAN